MHSLSNRPDKPALALKHIEQDLLVAISSLESAIRRIGWLRNDFTADALPAHAVVAAAAWAAHALTTIEITSGTNSSSLFPPRPPAPVPTDPEEPPHE